MDFLEQAEALAGFELTPAQKRWLQARDAPYSQIWGRREGSSTAAALGTVLNALYNPDAKQTVVCSVMVQCSHFIDKILRFNYEAVSDSFRVKSKTKKSVTFTNGAVVEFTSLGSGKKELKGKAVIDSLPVDSNGLKVDVTADVLQTVLYTDDLSRAILQ